MTSCMRSSAVFLFAALAMLPPVIDRGLNAADPATTAKAVAPYLDGDTIAVARIDLAAIDVDAAVERFAKASGVDVRQLAEPRRSIGDHVAAFRKAGVTELY